MIKIIFKKSFIFILFTISSLIYAEDSVKLKNIPPTSSENEVFNENIPAQISEANAEFIYKFLLAEIATQRGELNSAGHIYLDLAKLTKNIPLAERATRIAGSAKNGRLAMDSAEVWRKLDKTSIEPQRILAELFITSGNLTKARPLIKKLLKQEEKTI